MFDLRATTPGAGPQQVGGGASMGPQQVGGNTIPTPWAVNRQQPAINFTSPNYGLGQSQSSVLAQQQQLAQQLRQQGSDEIARRAVAKQEADAAAAAKKAQLEYDMAHQGSTFDERSQSWLQQPNTGGQQGRYYSNGEPVNTGRD